MVRVFIGIHCFHWSKVVHLKHHQLLRKSVVSVYLLPMLQGLIITVLHRRSCKAGSGLLAKVHYANMSGRQTSLYAQTCFRVPPMLSPQGRLPVSAKGISPRRFASSSGPSKPPAQSRPTQVNHIGSGANKQQASPDVRSSQCYKRLSRSVVASMVAIPMVIVISYELWQRRLPPLISCYL